MSIPAFELDNTFLDALFGDAEGFINIREIDEQARNRFITTNEAFDIPQDTNVYFGVYARSRKDGENGSLHRHRGICGQTTTT